MFHYKFFIASLVIGLTYSVIPTAMSATNEEKAFDYGVILRVSSNCHFNEYTSKAKLILKAQDNSWEDHSEGLEDRFSEAYKKGFYSLDEYEGFLDAEKIKLGTPYTNNKRKRYCNKLIIQHFQNYFKESTWD